MDNTDKVTMKADIDNLDRALLFVDKLLDRIEVGKKQRIMILIAVEELFVNVAKYAYAPKVGDISLEGEVAENPRRFVLTLRDRGIPFNPLSRPDPDVTLRAKDHKVGGLGIFLVKKQVDEMKYRYENGQNILTIEKRFD